ncbi:MAG: DNA-processing protein DprA [Beijerinckiaceae bacterium]|nr:DNA-processing protein DprA [Beijerinckiaceae bacterium]
MTGARLSDEQRLDWLQLIRSENVGPRTFRTLVNRFGGARAALAALPDLIARHGGGRRIAIAKRADCEREFEAARRMGARFLVTGDTEYPKALLQIDAPPPVICVLGGVSVFARPMVAVVGSRNASAAGLAFADRLVRELAQEDFVIASGLARGVDQRAHRAALATGTVAVLAGGLDKIYPPEHVGLAQEICERGAIISEMPLGCEPRGRDFPRRNRIVSGLSLGVVVVEAARKSGSLITARFANEQGREVFAVPGSPLDPRAEGCNDLLRQGATLCTSGADVIEALAPILSGGAAPRADLFDEETAFPAAERLWDETDLFGDPSPPLSEPALELDDEGAGSAPMASGQRFDIEPASAGAVKDAVAASLGPAPVSVDDVVRAAGFSVAQVHAALFDLELEGRLVRHGGNMVALLPRA